MSRRLLLSYLTLTVFVLSALVIPLGISYSRNEKQNLTTRVERDAVSLASLAEDTLERGDQSREALTSVAERYTEDTGGRVVIVDAQGSSMADSDAPEAAPRSFASRPEIAQALSEGTVATGVRRSSTLGTDLLYVAVPVASSGTVHGAVRITYPMSAVHDRVLRYWLILAAISAIVLAAVWVIGLRVARSIAKPLGDVERAAAAAGAGDLTARAPTDAGPPEVRSLAAGFNDTVAKLEELIRSREEFVADASHQLRTPLAAMRLRLENLEPEVSSEGGADLEAALSEVARLSRLVDGLLTLARADATDAVPGAVDLRAAVEERLDAWAALAGEQDVELAASVPDGLFARSTPGHLEQVLDNLLANALDVSPEGTTISVSGSGDAVWVELHVVDQGPGMTEEERSRAFDRFWRADSSEGGSGLGLAIIGRLVGSDGGHVELRAAAGGGVDAVVVLRAATPGGHAPTRGTRTAAPSPG